MRELVDAGLVRPVNPEEYHGDFEGFEDEFIARGTAGIKAARCRRRPATPSGIEKKRCGYASTAPDTTAGGRRARGSSLLP